MTEMRSYYHQRIDALNNDLDVLTRELADARDENLELAESLAHAKRTIRDTAAENRLLHDLVRVSALVTDTPSPDEVFGNGHSLRVVS